MVHPRVVSGKYMEGVFSLDITLVAAIIGALSAIFGVILGSAITGIGNWRERSRRRKNVRRVLSWEHDYNIGILEEFWKKVNQEGQSQGQFDYMKEFERNLRLSEENLDNWGHQMWQNYASEVASALSVDEFNQSYRLHSTLDMLASRQKSFAAIIHGDIGKNGMAAYSYDREKQLHSKSPGAYTPNDAAAVNNANLFVRPLWDECAKIYAICHQISNPIRS